MRQTRVPRNVTRSTKLRGAQRSAELALRSMDLRVPENLIFPALSKWDWVRPGVWVLARRIR